MSAERPSLSARGARSHGSLMPGAHADAGSEGDDFERDDSSEFERFDEAAQTALDARRSAGLEEEPDTALDDDDGDSGEGEDDEALDDDDF